VGEGNVEVSKGGVKAAVRLGFASGGACRRCRSEAVEAVEARVKAMSKQANFDYFPFDVFCGKIGGLPARLVSKGANTNGTP
jgi:hypothetical protein